MASCDRVDLVIKSEEILESEAEEAHRDIYNCVTKQHITNNGDFKNNNSVVLDFWGEVKIGSKLEKQKLTDKVKIETFNKYDVKNPVNCHYSKQLEEECKIENKNSIDKYVEKTKIDSNISCKKQDIEFIKIEESNNKYPTKLLHCVQCSYETVISRNLMKHFSANHLIKWLYCANCTFKCKVKSKLKSHISRRHSEERLVKCTKCEHTTKSTAYLRQHVINKHTPENFKWFSCDHCQYKAKYNKTLQRHILGRHTSEESIKWLRCEQCSHKSKTKDDLKRHVLYVHSRFRNFKCNFCDRDFKRNAHLRIHILSKHTSDDLIKWFECDLCSHKTKRKCNLKKHMRVHRV